MGLAHHVIDIMKTILLLFGIVLYCNPSLSQDKVNNSYHKEINRLENLIGKVVTFNISPPLESDKTIFSGWILIEKSKTGNSKVSFFSVDTNSVTKFVFPDKYDLSVNWNIVDNSVKEVLLMRKIIFGEIDADVYGDEIRIRNDKELELIQKIYINHKIVLLNPFVVKIEKRVS